VLRNANQKGMAFVQIFVISVTLVVVAVPEGNALLLRQMRQSLTNVALGLPLAVTLALAFTTKRMMKQNLLVRVLGSCETVAKVSVVCINKTTLTQNAMSVVAGSIGIHAKFVRKLADNRARTNANENLHNDFSIDQSNLNTVLNRPLCALCNAAIAVTSTAFECVEKVSGGRLFVGSETEVALLNFAKELGWSDCNETRASAEVVQMIPFSNDRKAMGVVVRHQQGYRFYVKGPSEILTKSCTRHVVVHRHGDITQC